MRANLALGALSIALMFGAGAMLGVDESSIAPAARYASTAHDPSDVVEGQLSASGDEAGAVVLWVGLGLLLVGATVAVAAAMKPESEQ